MLKNILNLEGASELTKKQQGSTLGGNRIPCSSDSDCASVCGKCVGSGICIYPTNGCA